MTKILEDIAPAISTTLAAYLAARAVAWLGQEPTKEDIEAMANEAAAEVDLSGFDELVEPAEEAIAEVGEAASDRIAGQVRLVVGDNYGALVNQVHEEALAYAHDRAAEMVGKKWEGDVLIDNPNAEMAITDTTRTKIRELVVQALSPSDEPFDLKIALEDLVDDVTGSPLFSRARAGLIAQAELGMAHSRGTLMSLVALEKTTGLPVLKRWSTAHDEKVCLELCAVNALEGAIPLSHIFPSGDFAPLAHPRCRCSLVGVVGSQPAAKAA